MRPLRILIADGSDTFCWALQMKLQEQYHVCVCTEGKSVLALARRFAPEIAVIDLNLPESGGLQLIQRLERELPDLSMLLISTQMDALTAGCMGKLRMESYIQKPFPMELLEERIDMLAYTRTQEWGVSDRNHIADMLMSLSMPVKLHGYRFVKEAIRIMAEDPQQSITKELYPAVAAACGATADQVERDIRGAICSAWKKRNEEVWRKYFFKGSNMPVSRPTNAEFVRTLAEVLPMDFRGLDKWPAGF